MTVGLELHLEERREDRVVVSFCLAPHLGGCAPRDDAEATPPPAPPAVRVDDVGLQLQSPEGEGLCPRTLLPIAGELTGPTATTVELRACGELPAGCRIVATAWTPSGPVQASIPADPHTDLRQHLRGAADPLPSPDDAPALRPLTPEEHRHLVAQLPWIDEPVRAPEVAGVIDVEDEPSVEDFQADFGLDRDQAEWLKDLLDEEDDTDPAPRHGAPEDARTHDVRGTRTAHEADPPDPLRRAAAGRASSAGSARETDGG